MCHAPHRTRCRPRLPPCDMCAVEEWREDWAGQEHLNASIPLSAVRRLRVVRPKRSRMMACRLELLYAEPAGRQGKSGRRNGSGAEYVGTGKEPVQVLELAQYGSAESAERDLALVERFLFPHKERGATEAAKEGQEGMRGSDSAAVALLRSDATDLIGGDTKLMRAATDLISGEVEDGLGARDVTGDLTEGTSTSQDGVRQRKKKKKKKKNKKGSA
eukprot:TRINITY_DN2297_c0_g1_i1.p1 TRINITY_DN2297_c0_g1~~TRINITY_DN2297_c0_g1_i1.p1  ORF type:complete len:217 (+),score=36.66 TRINITY_DN2297_c0_g1_i1:437-1087(+)